MQAVAAITDLNFQIKVKLYTAIVASHSLWKEKESGEGRAGEQKSNNLWRALKRERENARSPSDKSRATPVLFPRPVVLEREKKRKYTNHHYPLGLPAAVNMRACNGSNPLGSIYEMRVTDKTTKGTSISILITF